MRGKAFTLVEMLVVIAILAVLASIAFPVFSRSRHSAQEVATVQAVRQLGIALALYRTEHDGDGRYGLASQMGLPVFGSTALTSRFPFDLWWRTPCPPPTPQASAGFTYWPVDEQGPANYPPAIVAAWVSEVTAYQERTLIASTLNCTTPDWDLHNQFHPKLGLGIDLGIQLRIIRKSGLPTKMSWWQD